MACFLPYTVHKAADLGRVDISADDTCSLDVQGGVNRAVTAIVVCYRVCKLPALKTGIGCKVVALTRLHVGIFADCAFKGLWQQDAVLLLAVGIELPAVGGEILLTPLEL